MFFSMAMVQDWQFCKSMTDKLWNLADTVYIPKGIKTSQLLITIYDNNCKDFELVIYM